MTPAEMRAMSSDALVACAAEVRQRIVGTVAETGGHLASSLGAVEIAIAILRVFNPPVDRVLWDVGHQSYAWKILTDRSHSFGTLRQLNGISGFPNPDESPYDAFVAGHAGAALATAQGFAAARDLMGGTEHVVAVVGDAALLNGMALEALTGDGGRRLVLVVNDNGAEPERVQRILKASGFTVMDMVDGHDLAALETALTAAKSAETAVAVHVRTVKGRGFSPAEADPVAWHGVSPFGRDLVKSDSGETRSAAAEEKNAWSDVCGAALADWARRDGRVCALTAAMREGTGLASFAREFPDRFFDVGICEERLVAFAAGLAKAGMHPVVAVYSTFLQRAIDQVMHDVCLLRLPVVFMVDRAGCVGHDGRTHHGMFDIPMLRCLPGLAICQPSNAEELRGMLAEALKASGPCVIRYPRGAAPLGPEDMSPLQRGVARQLSGANAKLQLWALGDWVEKAQAVAVELKENGIFAGVVDARYVKPFDRELLRRQRSSEARIVSLENGAVEGGFGEAIGADLRFGWPDAFVGHGDVAELERQHGLDASSITQCILEDISTLHLRDCLNFMDHNRNFL